MKESESEGLLFRRGYRGAPHCVDHYLRVEYVAESEGKADSILFLPLPIVLCCERSLGVTSLGWWR